MKQIYHPWHEWECFRAGFYETTHGAADPRELYREFLADIPRFERAMTRVLEEWPRSCEQFLSNVNINRIAWLGQAAMCIDTGVPSIYRGGFKRLPIDAQRAANAAAEKTLETWLAQQN